MTKQESFKRSVRARMAKTGEKYGAARRALLDSRSGEVPSGDSWVEEPETTDDAVREATGRGWDEWCTLIDEWPERTEGHAAMAARMGRDHLDNGWWAQTVIVGYERIRGLRTKYMRADGTFAGSVTRTLGTGIDAERLRASLLDDDGRASHADRLGEALGQPVEIELRSRPGSKAIRWAIHPAHGSPVFSISEQPDGRLRVAIQHESLSSTEAVEHWREVWADWLADVG